MARQSSLSDNLVSQCLNALKSLKNSRVLVVGDVMWDEYIYGDASRVSPEAPVPVVLMDREDRTPGGAFNVLKNLIDLQVKCGIAGIVGDDLNGKAMKVAARQYGIEHTELWQASDRPTTIKTRILARNQQLLRVDKENARAIDTALEKKILRRLAAIIPEYNGVILSDYDKGMLTEGMIGDLISVCRKNNVFVSVDPQVRHFRRYTHAGIMTPNEKEASGGIEADFPESDEDAVKLGLEILKQLSLDSLLLTRSAKGMMLFEKDESIKQVTCHAIPTVAREVFDVTGAGDTVIAVYTALIAGKVKPRIAALLANIAGGIVVGRLGTSTVNRQDLAERIDDDHLESRTFKKDWIE